MPPIIKNQIKASFKLYHESQNSSTGPKLIHHQSRINRFYLSKHKNSKIWENDSNPGGLTGGRRSPPLNVGKRRAFIYSDMLWSHLHPTCRDDPLKFSQNALGEENRSDIRVATQISDSDRSSLWHLKLIWLQFVMKINELMLMQKSAGLMKLWGSNKLMIKKVDCCTASWSIRRF